MIAEVIVEVSSSEVDKVFDYEIPSSFMQEKLVGRRAIVPFGPRKIEGYILKTKETSNLPSSKLKSIISLLDSEPIILPEMIELASFMKYKFHLKMVDCLRLFIPSQMRGEKVKPVFVKSYVLSENFNENAKKLNKNAKKQQEIIDFLLKNKIIEPKDVKNFSPSALKNLEKQGIVITKEIQEFRKPMKNLEISSSIKHILNSAQKNALERIKGNKTFLLHGVTGSGKTEVYMNVIEREIANGKTAIMLVPEISLTPQVLRNFKERFGNTVAILHSGLSAGERFDEWNRLLSGDAKIAIGARSAIFAPLKNLGVIIIDEEHDGSYVSESNPRYNTFEIATFRAKYNECSLVLGSATPSIETYYLAKEGKIEIIELPVRVNGKEMPAIEIVDMLGEIRAGNNGVFSRRLLGELEECFKQKKQAILFLNRRGYVSFLRCRECGYVAKCSDCDVSLVYHKSENKLVCHYCGKKFKVLTACPECGSTHIREGAIGTENVVAQFKQLFPDIPVLRMDNDTTRTKDAHQKILSAFSKQKPGVLIGTQMIAKGHDFPDVTVVGILDADQGLFQSHYKSAERTFALITQVAGRAGRSESEGKVVLQTYCPKKYVYNLAANYDYKGFYKREINLRQTTLFPPFSTILRVMFNGDNEEEVKNSAKACYEEILEMKKSEPNNFIYLNAMKSPVSKIKQKFRYQILVRLKGENIDNLIQKVYNACDRAKTPRVLCFVEINPQSLS